MDYTKRPGAPVESPRQTIERLERELAAARRDRPRETKKPLVVRLDAEESTSWAPGTPWLDMSVVLTDGDI
ncbi:hypothetical protein [Terrabacter sp. C0L_2]|uniref:hypothetical protein n=1 Tax=Terrabacter sp. C0L_2 TaxID=3108389 RepID=UPI002ED1EC83|nr:hypothetical protein U5C87_17855 [Terrabacter sp. C0L_2]